MATRMEMPEYLSEIRYAVSGLLPLVWHEREILQDLRTRLELLKRQVEDEYRAADWLALNAEDTETYMLAIGRGWDNYFGPGKEMHTSQQEHDEIAARVQVRHFAASELAGSVLQHAKQGLSLVHGGPPEPARGRPVGSQLLSEVVWQGRNQANHWSEGAPHRPVEKCFETLVSDFGVEFGAYRLQNLALKVVELLGWRTLDDFEKDMLTMV